MSNVTPSGVGPITDIIQVGLFKTRICPGGVYAYEEALTCDLTLTGPEDMICCETPILAGGAANYLDPGDGYIFAWKCAGEAYVSIDLQGTMYLRVRHVIAP